MKLNTLKNYYKISFINSNNIFKRKSNLLRYYFYIMLYIITLPFLLTGSCVSLAFYTMARNVSKGYKSYGIFDSFKALNNKNVLYKTIVSKVLGFAMKLVILLVIVLVTLPFVGIGWVLMLSTKEVLYIYLSLIPTIIGSVVYILYLIFGCIPLAQIFAEDNNISITNALKLSFTASLKSTKHQMILSIVFELLFKAVFIFIIVLIVLVILYYRTIFSLKYDQLRSVILAIIVVLLGTIYLILMPRVSLLNIVMRRNIRHDIILNYSHIDEIEFSKEIFKIKTSNVIYKNKEDDNTSVDNNTESTDEDINGVSDNSFEVVDNINNEVSLNNESSNGSNNEVNDEVNIEDVDTTDNNETLNDNLDDALNTSEEASESKGE